MVNVPTFPLFEDFFHTQPTYALNLYSPTVSVGAFLLILRQTKYGTKHTE